MGGTAFRHRVVPPTLHVHVSAVLPVVGGREDQRCVVAVGPPGSTPPPGVVVPVGDEVLLFRRPSSTVGARPALLRGHLRDGLRGWS